MKKYLIIACLLAFPIAANGQSTDNQDKKNIADSLGSLAYTMTELYGEKSYTYTIKVTSKNPEEHIYSGFSKEKLQEAFKKAVTKVNKTKIKKLEDGTEKKALGRGVFSVGSGTGPDQGFFNGVKTSESLEVTEKNASDADLCIEAKATFREFMIIQLDMLKKKEDR